MRDEPRAGWIGTGLVTAERVVPRREPDDAWARARPTLVRFGAVAVREARARRLQVAYPGGEGARVIRWRENEIATATAAARVGE